MGGAVVDEIVHFREEGEGDEEDWGLTAIRLYCTMYIIGKSVRAKERTGG